MLGHEVAKRAVESGISGNLACSIVSSSALAKVAEKFNLGYRETLTGFKWISKVPNLIFGFEEALVTASTQPAPLTKTESRLRSWLRRLHADLAKRAAPFQIASMKWVSSTATLQPGRFQSVLKTFR
nr:hypothetical protein [Rhodoluna sp. KAS3]